MSELLPGIEVKVRGLRWELVETQHSGEQTLYRLRGLEGVVQGIEIDIMNPLEEIVPLATEINPEKAGPLKHWLIYHQAFLLEQVLGSAAILSVQPGRLKLEPYQIVPLMRALKMNRPRLLLCDDVGLGKTIEAAFIVTELMARRLAHRLLIVSPAGPLLKQWKNELLDRFGLRVEVIDRQKIEEKRKSSELGANPFDQIPLGLISIDFLKQERLLEQLGRTTYDIIIIDEAHHCSDLGTTQEYDDSLRRNLAKILATRCDILLLLTATPHNGNDRSFASLLELLDFSLVDGRGNIREDRYKPYVVRRLKKHIKDNVTGEHKFKDRKVIPIPVTANTEKHGNFIDFQKSLLALIGPELKSAFRSRRYSDVLAFISLLKRSASTAYSCLKTLEVVRNRYDEFISEKAENIARRKERISTLREYSRKIERFGTISYEEEQEQQNLMAEDIAEQLSVIEKQRQKDARRVKKVENIRDEINKLISLAEKAIDCDPKFECLIKEIKNIRGNAPEANILVFTEYTDSQEIIIKKLEEAILGKILRIHGGDQENERIKITERFSSEDNIILVSTDASAEGLNLQKKCHHLIHVELPFNPNRLEQRNGRIDRYGQEEYPIIRYMFLKDTFEDRILLRLIAKYERQRSKLSFVPDTLGITCSTDASCEKLLKGIMDEEEKLFKDNGLEFDFSNPEEDKLNTPAVKELLEEIDRSFKGYEKAIENNIWLGESGVNAETNLITEASRASEEGSKLSNVDLMNFVCDAVKLDGGEVVEEKGIFEIKLPPLWNYGLDDLPGYNSSNRTIKITTNLDIFEDRDGNTVGFLGRSHPLVKKALDRVRNISFGYTATSVLDHRATAVKGKDNNHHLLFTFIGAILTKKGKTYEKVFSIKADKDGNMSRYLMPEEWLSYAKSEKAISTKNIWEKFFASWGEKAKENTFKIAKETFKPIADEYIKDQKQSLEKELSRINEWFEMRVKEISGTVQEAIIQYELFDSQEEVKKPHWVSMLNPEERISAFANDKNNIRARISEAETLLKLYRKRKQDIEEFSTFEKVTLRPIGIMMILPCSQPI